MVDLKDKRAVVIGLGTSGIAACRLLAARGARVVGTDAKTREASSAEVRALEAEGVTLVLGGHEGAFEGAELVVVSPGVPPLPVFAALEEKGVRIWGEVELAVQALAKPAPVVAI